MAKKKNPLEGLIDELESIAEIDGRTRLYMPALGRVLVGETLTAADKHDAKIALKVLSRAVRAMKARFNLGYKLAREGKAGEALELLKQGRRRDSPV